MKKYTMAVIIAFPILRMYGPLKPWIDKTWRPGEVEPME
jgi:hypothetical protein